MTASLLGGLGLFLLGMRLMTDGLKLAAGEALATLLQAWTRSAPRGLAVGALITAVVQSSSLVTVATIGFVNAGLLSLAQAVWLVFGANVGTTMTGWLVALVGVKIDPAALALPMLGIGALLALAAGRRPRLAGAGQALTGFGAFFLGVAVLQSGFAGLAQTWALPSQAAADPATLLAFVAVGAAITVATQSSSAAVAIVLTAAAGGAASLPLAAAAVIGANVGTTSTAVFAALSATAAARRVAAAHIAFNLMTGAVALALLVPLLAVVGWIGRTAALPLEPATQLAIFHTLFNVLGVLLVLPLAPWMVSRLSRMFVTPAEDLARPRHLDATLLGVPAVALRGLELELARMRDMAGEAMARRLAGAQAGADPFPLGEAFRSLAGQARGFVASLQTHPLSEDVVARLPDLLRALQHLEDLLELAEAWRAPPALPEELRAELDALAQTARSGLLAGEAGAAEAAERRYQQLKQRLLRAAAEGSLPVRTMDEALIAARRLREAAVLAGKADRRLAGLAAPAAEA